MTALVFLSLFLGMSVYSSATYCICNSGISDTVLQKSIDYACGSGADCSPILQSGGCYQPNTVKSHCDYAVNNYYQRKGQATDSCAFSGTATVSSTLPSTVVSSCTYPASPSQVTSSTSTTTGTPGTTSTDMGPSSSIGPTGTGSSSPSHHASSILVAVTTLVSGYCFS